MNLGNMDKQFCHSFLEKISALISGKSLNGKSYRSPRNMVPYLRSPYNSGIREMVFYDGFRDLRCFDNNEYRHIVLSALLAGGGVSGPFASLFRDNEDLSFCERNLWDMGFFVSSDNASILYHSTIKDLSVLLRSANVPVPSGKKEKYVECVLQNVCRESIDEFCSARQGHEPSDLGYWMIRSLYNDENVEIPPDVVPLDCSPRHRTSGRIYTPINLHRSASCDAYTHDFASHDVDISVK